MVMYSKVKGVVNNFSKSLVGKLCKRIELIEEKYSKHANLESKQFVEDLRMLKAFTKNLIYEEARVLGRVLFCLIHPSNQKELIDIIFTGEENGKCKE